ncbi:11-beta-hydroxysteroid dehydrogenase-like [Typha angustifolia]|uniref:11-beta-hydroxysteroid dehydrogenase-like n=1 Tax=Typha angustifolia TaxID=59011 RepID=UPI003C2D7BFA
MAFFNFFLSVVTHVAIAVFLVAYLPVSLLFRLFAWVFLRPFKKEDLRGKVVLITGASSGIGEKIAYEYARRGASLALVARREKALKVVAGNARSYGAPGVLVLPADIADIEQSRRVVDKTVAHFGQLNHLVANAGIWSCCSFEKITNLTAFNQMMDVNFWGAVYPTYYALPHLKASRGNIIVNTSLAGRFPTANMTLYNASKAAVIRFFETLRSEVGSEIKITILIPGYIESEITKGKGLQNDGNVRIDKKARDVHAPPIPVARPEKLAEAAVESACRGDVYVTWPSWYGPLHILMSLAPEVVNYLSHLRYKKILRATKA